MDDVVKNKITCCLENAALVEEQIIEEKKNPSYPYPLQGRYLKKLENKMNKWMDRAEKLSS